jgi:hypothetical protein
MNHVQYHPLGGVRARRRVEQVGAVWCAPGGSLERGWQASVRAGPTKELVAVLSVENLAFLTLLN